MADGQTQLTADIFAKVGTDAAALMHGEVRSSTPLSFPSLKIFTELDSVLISLEQSLASRRYSRSINGMSELALSTPGFFLPC